MSATRIGPVPTTLPTLGTNQQAAEDLRLFLQQLVNVLQGVIDGRIVIQPNQPTQ
jgi:hypothetical protein